MKLEQRTITNNLEVRQQDGKKGVIAGYGIVYGQRTQIYSDLYEIILPGAASEFLASEPDIRCCFNHDRNYILGRTKSGTLSVREDPNGVFYEVQVPDTQWARDLSANMERGDIDGSSFTFGVNPDGETVTKQADGTYLREIRKLAIVAELGPVTMPAYPTTTANVRSAQETYDSFTESLRTQDESDKIAAKRQTHELRNKFIFVDHIIRSERIETN